MVHDKGKDWRIQVESVSTMETVNIDQNIRMIKRLQLQVEYSNIRLMVS